MATQRPTNRPNSSVSGYGNTVGSAAGNRVGSSDSTYGTLKLLGRVLVYVAIVVFVVLSFLASIETMWMKAEIKSEAKELRRLRRELEDQLSKERNEKASVSKPSPASADGL
jgi:hypothetical protein